MAKKAALGRGLSALLPEQEGQTEETRTAGESMPTPRLYNFEDRVRLLGRVADLDVDSIRPNPYQPRKDFNEETLDELAASISQLGIIQPVTVRALGGSRFEIISGERRLRAARRAGLKRIPAYVREADTEEMLEMAIVENVQRDELNPIEVAVGYQRLIEECSLTQEHVAKKVGKNRTTVTNFLRLLKLPAKLQASLRDGIVSMGHARALINVDDEDVQLTFLEAILEEGLSVRQVETRVRAWRKAQSEDPDDAEAETPAVSERDQLQLDSFTDQLRDRFSTKIQIKHKSSGGGRIEISYYSNDDLERLMDLLRT